MRHSFLMSPQEAERGGKGYSLTEEGAFHEERGPVPLQKRYSNWHFISPEAENNSQMLTKFNSPLLTGLSFQEQSHLQFWSYCPRGFLLF